MVCFPWQSYDGGDLHQMTTSNAIFYDLYFYSDTHAGIGQHRGESGVALYYYESLFPFLISPGDIQGYFTFA